jgi:hypothetical protein
LALREAAQGREDHDTKVETPNSGLVLAVQASQLVFVPALIVRMLSFTFDV